MLLQYSLFMYHKNLLHDQEPIPIYDIGIGSHLEHAKSYPLITTLTLWKLGTYPGRAGGMLTVSPQRECCGQEHGGRGCPHRRSGGC